MNKIILLLLAIACSAILSCSPDRSHPDSYSFKVRNVNEGEIKRVTCYKIPRRIWWLEDEMIARGFPSVTIKGIGAEQAWTDITHREKHYETVTNLAYTNDDYLVIAETEEGIKFAFIICQTFHTELKRLLVCKTPDEWWMAAVDEPVVDLLNMK